LCSPQEFYTWTRDWQWTPTLGHYLPEHFLHQPDTLINCPQHVLLDTQHLLYEKPLPPVATQTIEVLHDTSASISKLPAEFSFAWTNVRPCLHRISGCFKGGEQDNNEVGEFHALLTLDSGETTRAIIPEAILASAATTNTYLLAHVPLLMAGHEYICSLDRPRLKCNDGGEYTMSVKRDHQIIKLQLTRQQHTLSCTYTRLNPTIHLPTSTVSSSTLPAVPTRKHRSPSITTYDSDAQVKQC
jgi:hypothetical protein